MDRAVDSAENFAQGLTGAFPAVAGDVSPVTTDADLLYFHDSDANADYKDYEESDPRLKAVDDQIADLPRTREVSRHMMLRLYSEDFVNRLSAGEFSLVDRGKGSSTIDNEVDAAYMLYNTYIITPGMAEEGKWNFERFIEPADAQWLAYTNDAEDFYAKARASPVKTSPTGWQLSCATSSCAACRNIPATTRPGSGFPVCTRRNDHPLRGTLETAGKHRLAGGG